MDKDEERRAQAERFAADQLRRRVAEAEIAAKEAVLAREVAKLERLQAEAEALDAELAEAKAERSSAPPMTPANEDDPE